MKLKRVWGELFYIPKETNPSKTYKEKCFGYYAKRHLFTNY